MCHKIFNLNFTPDRKTMDHIVLWNKAVNFSSKKPRIVKMAECDRIVVGNRLNK